MIGEIKGKRTKGDNKNRKQEKIEANGLKVIILGTYEGPKKRNYRCDKIDFRDDGLKVIISFSNVSNLTKGENYHGGDRN